MAIPATAGYTVDDLDWLRDELGIAHVELDPWGSIIVTPATDEHEIVLAMLHEQAVRQLDLPPGSVWSNGFAWKVPEGSGYTNVPDLVVLAPGWTRVAGNHVSPPPLLVVEVASPSTRAVDRGRKLSDYRTGGAGCYLLADVPALTRGGEISFELHDFEAGAITTTDGSVDLVLEGRAVRFDLTSFRGRILGQ
jgi:Uma2 family endonuclease